MLNAITWFHLSKWVLVAAAVGGVWWHGFTWGNDWGSNARAYRAVLADLAAKNKELDRLRFEDARIVSEEETASREADSAFAEAAPRLKKMIIDADQAKALNALIGE